jgi:hypothetical protein
MRLAETQAALWPAITERKSGALDEDALDRNALDQDALDRNGLDRDALDRIVRAEPRLSPQRRVEIYAQMYFWRQVEALKEDFPKLAALLGDDAFAHLVDAYVHTYPSDHPSLGRLGRKLAQFLAEHRAENGRPDLADLAALEWARAEVFVELDAPLAPASIFTGLSPDQFAKARLCLVPAVRVFSFEHDAMALWRAVERGDPVPEPIPHPRHVLVWRKGWTVFHATIDAEEAQALEWAGQGRTLGEVCEAFAERDEPVAAAFAALQSWLAESLVSRVELT